MRTRVAKFWIYCNLEIVLVGRPVKRALQLSRWEVIKDMDYSLLNFNEYGSSKCYSSEKIQI